MCIYLFLDVMAVKLTKHYMKRFFSEKSVKNNQKMKSEALD